MKDKNDWKKRIGKIGALVILGLFLALSIVSPCSAAPFGEGDTNMVVEDDPPGNDGYIYWEEDGNEFMRLTGDKLGIGTTTPDKLLHLGDDTNNIDGELRFEASDGDLIDLGITTSDKFYITGGSVGIGTTAPVSTLSVAGEVVVSSTWAYTYSAPTNGMIVEGNVGIGVMNPAEKLEINGNVLFNYGSARTIYIETPSSNAHGKDLTVRAGHAYEWGTLESYLGGNLYLSGGDGAGGVGIHGGNVYISGGGPDIPGYPYICGDVILAHTGSAVRGQVGIGSTTTNQLLDVNGKIEIGDDDTAATAGAMRWTGSNFEGYTGSVWKPLDVQAPSGGGWTRDETNGEVELTVASDKVGIGTTSPNAKLDVRGTAIFNDGSGDYDFRIEGDGDANLFFVDAGNDRIGIGTNSPNAKLDVRGTAIFNDGSGDNDFRIESDGNENIFFVDAGNNNIGIGTATPRGALNVDNTGEAKGLGVMFDTYYQQTSGVTPAAIATISTEADKVYGLTVTVIGIDGTNDDVAHFVRHVTYERHGATLAIVGLPSTPHTQKDDNVWSVTFTTSGTNIVINVNGGIGDTVQWQATVEKNIVGI